MIAIYYFDLINIDFYIVKSMKYIKLKTYENYFNSSLIKTKNDIKRLKMKYRKNPKIYKN